MIRPVHGPFTSQRDREDRCLWRLEDKQPCLCDQCESLPPEKRPTEKPKNMIMTRGHEPDRLVPNRSYWIGQNTEV